MLALQNENIFIDKLTGLYNRYYLDKISGKLKRKKENYDDGARHE
jgi:GGDEF domain-containing protein